MKRPPIKDGAIKAYVDDLEERLSKYEKSPYVKTYLTMLNQVNDFNEQLTIQQVEVQDGDNKRTVTVGRINLFGEKDEKEFERSFKYMLEVNGLLDSIEKIRMKMSASEKEEVKKINPDTADGFIAS